MEEYSVKETSCELYISAEGSISLKPSPEVGGKYTVDQGVKFPNSGWCKFDDKTHVHTDDDNIIYVGDEKNGLKHGIGVCSYPDGSAYDGCWVNGKKHGSGIYLYSGNQI
jgi:hypothetical protein